MEVAVCHWVRDAGFDRERARPALPPSEPLKTRPRRLAGAAAAAAVAAFAALALLLPDSTPADEAGAPAVPVASAMPPADAAGPRFDLRAAAAPDDPVPVASDGKAAGGGCSHDL
jgi:hypothetical protein